MKRVNITLFQKDHHRRRLLVLASVSCSIISRRAIVYCRHSEAMSEYTIQAQQQCCNLLTVTQVVGAVYEMLGTEAGTTGKAQVNR